MIPVRLTKSQMAQAYQCASARGLVMRAAQIANQQVSKAQSGMDVELLGVKAEFAVATIFQVDFQPMAIGVDVGSDLFIDDIGVDVKSTFHQNGQMLFRSPNHFKADICVLATSSDQPDVINVIGWLSKQDFLTEARPSPNQKFTGIAVPQGKLKSLGTLWEGIIKRRLSK